MRFTILLILFFGHILHGQYNLLESAGSFEGESQVTTSEVYHMLHKVASSMQTTPEDPLKSVEKDLGGIWVSGQFGLYIILEDTGEILHAPTPKRSDANLGKYLVNEEINAKGFAHLMMQKISNQSSSKLSSDIFQGSGSQSSNLGIFFSRVVSNIKGNTYILTAGSSDWGMQRFIVEQVINDATSLLSISGDNAFEDITKEDWIFQFPNSKIYILDTQGGVVYSTAKYTPDPLSTYTEGEEAFVTGLIGKAMNTKDGAWYFGKWGGKVTGPGKEIAKWYFAKVARYRDKTYIVTTGIDASFPDVANLTP